MTWRKQFLNGSSWNMAGIGLAQLFAFGFISYAARFLDAREFGIAAVGILVIELTRDLMLGGLPDCLVREECWREDVARSCLLFQLLAAIALAVMTFAAGALVAGQGSPDIGMALMAISCVFLIEAAGSVSLARLRHQRNYRAVGIGQTLGGVATVLIGIISLSLGAGFMAVIYARIGAAAAVTLANLWLSDWQPRPGLSLTPLKPVRAAAFHIVLTKMLSVLNVKATDLIVGFIGGPVLLGSYQMASRLLNFVLQTVLAPAQAVTLSMFAAAGQSADLRHSLINTLSLLAFFVFPVATGLAAISPEFVVLFFGRDWVYLSAPVSVLLLACIPASINYQTFPVLVRIDRVKVLTRFMLILTTIGVVFTLLSAPWGLTAVAIAFTARTAVGSIIAMRVLRRETGIAFGEILQAIAVPAAGSLAIVVSTSVVGMLVAEMTDIARVSLLVLVGACAYGLVTGLLVRWKPAAGWQTIMPTEFEHRS